MRHAFDRSPDFGNIDSNSRDRHDAWLRMLDGGGKALAGTRSVSTLARAHRHAAPQDERVRFQRPIAWPGSLCVSHLGISLVV